MLLYLKQKKLVVSDIFDNEGVPLMLIDAPGGATMPLPKLLSLYPLYFSYSAQYTIIWSSKNI